MSPRGAAGPSGAEGWGAPPTGRTPHPTPHPRSLAAARGGRGAPGPSSGCIGMRTGPRPEPRGAGGPGTWELETHGAAWGPHPLPPERIPQAHCFQDALGERGVPAAG
ncbi:unnamed protein product [Rangifer tarandus platyrhynchus]|uniref:Uncharacterized protein n=2 Tax=Rangifer tarandus platyrhynchus TaxID=3082113 RepID=A0ABN8Z5H3_RANTA|nr:unnamed protein product [Rangifer tarandus platyrhynchus]CAI9704150.1 unnamed protein product [Rangifer tarandus platyrhynchus]